MTLQMAYPGQKNNAFYHCVFVRVCSAQWQVDQESRATRGTEKKPRENVRVCCRPTSTLRPIETVKRAEVWSSSFQWLATYPKPVHGSPKPFPNTSQSRLTDILTETRIHAHAYSRRVDWLFARSGGRSVGRTNEQMQVWSTYLAIKQPIRW